MRSLIYFGYPSRNLCFLDDNSNDYPIFLFVKQEKLKKFLFLKGYTNKEIQITSKRVIIDIIEIIELVDGGCGFEIYKNRKTTLLSRNQFIALFS